MSIIIYAGIFLIVFVLLILLLFLIFIIDSVARGHDLPTSKRAAKSIKKIISEHKAAGSFYDLGCGHGALAVCIKRKFPALFVSAIDNNLIRIFFAKIRALLFWRDVKFLRKNIFDVDLRDVDIVYAYLWYDLMPPLERKLLKELKPGAIVITNTSNFPTWKPFKTIITNQKSPNFEKLFIYKN